MEASSYLSIFSLDEAQVAAPACRYHPSCATSLSPVLETNVSLTSSSPTPLRRAFNCPHFTDEETGEKSLIPQHSTTASKGGSQGFSGSFNFKDSLFPLLCLRFSHDRVQGVGGTLKGQDWVSGPVDLAKPKADNNSSKLQFHV